MFPALGPIGGEHGPLDLPAEVGLEVQPLALAGLIDVEPSEPQNPPSMIHWLTPHRRALGGILVTSVMGDRVPRASRGARPNRVEHGHVEGSWEPLGGFFVEPIELQSPPSMISTASPPLTPLSGCGRPIREPARLSSPPTVEGPEGGDGPPPARRGSQLLLPRLLGVMGRHERERGAQTCSRCKNIKAAGVWQFSAPGGPYRAPGPSKNGPG